MYGMDEALEGDGKIYRQGYLRRKKAVAKSVKRRWFCLNTDAFVTFRTEESARNNGECTEILPLVDIQTVKQQHTGSHTYPFEIITRQKTHVFLTDSAYEQGQWVQAFHTAMKLRCFHAKKDQVVSKSTPHDRERRSSSISKKLSVSNIKRYVQDGLKPGTPRKSSGVDCDPSETEYQGIPIGSLDGKYPHDDVFEDQNSEPQEQYQPSVTVPEVPSSNGHTPTLTCEDHYQDVSSLKMSETTPSSVVEREELANGSSTVPKFGQIVDFDNNAVSSVMTTTMTTTTTTSLPPPIPAPNGGLSMPQKRVFPEEQIYDLPPRIDAEEEDIYDTPAREDVDDIPAESEAMSELKRMLAAADDASDIDDDEDDDDDLATYTDGDEDYHSLEIKLTEQGVQKSAVDDLRNLLDSLDEL